MSTHTLTPRELEVARLLCDGHKQTTIATLLNCSVKTVEKHFENIYAKLGCNDRLSCYKYCIAYGITTPPPLQITITQHYNSPADKVHLLQQVL